jgi:ribosomal protein S27E
VSGSIRAWGVNRRPVVERPPVVLVCEACGREGCKAEQIEDPNWWVRVACPACGHVQMVGRRGVPA